MVPMGSASLRGRSFSSSRYSQRGPALLPSALSARRNAYRQQHYRDTVWRTEPQPVHSPRVRGHVHPAGSGNRLIQALRLSLAPRRGICLSMGPGTPAGSGHRQQPVQKLSVQEDRACMGSQKTRPAEPTTAFCVSTVMPSPSDSETRRLKVLRTPNRKRFTNLLGESYY